MTKLRAYESPAAFRRALTDRLKAKEPVSRWTLSQLQRQFAYDRLLARLYSTSNDWIVKGATALLARDIAVRATIDIDVYRDVALEVAIADLREAAALDIGDWFQFTVGPIRPVGDAGAGARLPVTAYIGPAIWAEFHIDVVGQDLRMTGHPDDVPALAQVRMPDLEQPGYRAYPLVDHVADKIAAMIEIHGDDGAPSSRYKDLVDLVAVVTAASIPAEPQMRAIQSEAQRRSLRLPLSFVVPDRRAWERGYAAEAARSLLTFARSLDEAVVLVAPFLNALLDGSAKGVWDPKRRTWVLD